MRRIIAVSLGLLASVAAAAAFQQAPTPATGLVLGRVLDADSKTPLAGVVVTLAGGSQPSLRVVTDGQGRFLFRGLAKGTYVIATTVGGDGFSPNGFIVSGAGFPIGAYLNGGFGQRRPNGPLQSIELDEGQRIGDVTIRMWKSGAISGRVLDEAGEPLVNHVVGVVRMTSDGRLTTGPTVKTDDHGAYRFGTLAPGRYFVFVPETQVSMPVSVGEALVAGPPDPAATQRFSLANAPSPTLGGVRVGSSVVSTTPDPGRFGGGALISNALAPIRDGDQLHVYSTTFFPSATRLAQALRITIAPGEERSSVEVQLRPVRAVPVSGVLVDSAGPVPGIGLHLMPADMGEDASVLEVAATATDSRGAFTFPVVPSGQYTVIAWRIGGVPTGNTQQPIADPRRIAEQAGAWAMQSISVGSRPVENVTVTIRPPVTVSGRVEFVGSNDRPPAERLLSGVAVTVWQARSLFRSPGPSSGSTIDLNAGGRIAIRGVSPPGRYFLGAPALPAPWSLESITVGGRDATDTAFQVGDADITDVVITYTDRPASLKGTVTTERTSVESDTSVFIFPAGRARWADARVSRSFRVIRTTKAGTFTWGNLLPGDYLIVAIRDDDAGDWPDEQFLTKLAAVATPIKIAAHQEASIALRVRDLK